MLPWDIKLLMLTNLTELIKWSEKYFYSKSEFSFVSSLALFWFLFNFGGKRNFEKSRMMHENGLVKVYRWCRCAATIRRKKSSIQKRIISLIGCLIDFYRLVKRLRGISLDFEPHCLFLLTLMISNHEHAAKIIRIIESDSRKREIDGNDFCCQTKWMNCCFFDELSSARSTEESRRSERDRYICWTWN